MDVRRLARADLNLLVAFQVLMEERNVGRAASRLYVTQPAMSKTLARMRLLFGNQLFTRARGGMVPTPRALELYADLEPLLRTADEVLGRREVGPGQYSGQFHIMALDFFAIPLVPRLMQELGGSAPDIQLRVSQDLDNHLADLAEGRLDFVINGRRDDYTDDDLIVDEIWGELPLVLMVREGHPLTGLDAKARSWSEVRKYPELAFNIATAQQSRGSWMHSRLWRHLDPAAVALEISDYYTAQRTLVLTDCIMVAPCLDFGDSMAAESVTTLPLPSSAEYKPIDLVLVYHRRTAESRIHRWLRGQIMNIYAEHRGRSQP